MTVTEVAAIPAVLAGPTVLTVCPRYEGSNIGAWIGFKHINYLVEEAVLAHFRDHGFAARRLFEDYSLGLDFVELDTRILTALHLDELVTARVTPKPDPDAAGLRFAVTLTADRDGSPTKCVTSKARVVLRLDERTGPAVPPPPALAKLVVPTLREAGSEQAAAPPAADAVAVGVMSDDAASDDQMSGETGSSGADPVLDRLIAGRNAFGWKRRMPYFYCHFTDRVQMSGYLRQMEEVVDLFLADRGISVRTLLDEHGWIPVVPHSRVRVLDEALMEEDLYTVFAVEDIFKDFTYTARMDCYVVRDGRIVPTATGVITHGYAAIGNRSDFGLVSFDDRVLRALRGDPSPH